MYSTLQFLNSSARCLKCCPGLSSFIHRSQELGGGADTDKNIWRFSQKNKNTNDEKENLGVILKSSTRVLGGKLVVSRKHEGEYQVAKPAVKQPDNFFTLSSLA